MFRNSPYIASAISTICRTPALKVIAEIPDLDFDRVEEYLKLIIDFFRDNSSILGSMDYVIELVPSCPSGNISFLTPQSLIDAMDSGANVVLVDNQLNIQGVERIANTSQTELSQYSRKKKSCVIHVFNCADIVIYANGMTVKETNLQQPLQGPVTRKKYARSAHDYKLSLLEHYRQRIRYGGNYTDHWEDRQRRILRNLPKKTERIFHDNLQNWLEENLEGAVVQGGVKKVTADETDIEIRLHGDSRFYILEIKWLGNNGSTSYTESRVRDGIHQVKEYLKRDDLAYEACLVVYDGRLLTEFNKLECMKVEPEQWKEVEKCQTEAFPPRGKGYVFFLESKSASD